MCARESHACVRKYLCTVRGCCGIADAAGSMCVRRRLDVGGVCLQLDSYTGDPLLPVAGAPEALARLSSHYRIVLVSKFSAGSSMHARIAAAFLEHFHEIPPIHRAGACA